VTKRGDALALAVELSSGNEAYLGPSDVAMCVEALTKMSKRRTNAPGFLAGATMAFVMFASVHSVGISGANSEVSLIKDAANRWEDVMKTNKPVQHTSPVDLEMQRFTTGFIPNG
jgi:hypothetical protein